MRCRQARHQLTRDLFYVIFGICIAIVLSWSGFFDLILDNLGNGVFASFIAGVFFTSAFTIAPSSVALVHLIETTPMFTVILWGALGALSGDIILFFFIRDRFADDLKNSLKPSFVRHIARSFHFGFLKWLAPILGAVVIASPLPDELGLTLLGLSKTRLAFLVPISFVMNALGIYLLARLVSIL